MIIRRQYVDVADRQVHLRYLRAADSGAPVLVCLHPAPYSGAYFDTVMPMLAKTRTVVAVDYPGYGSSDAIGDTPTIADYATSTAAAIRELVGDEAVDVLGFHTGCLVGAEWSLLANDQICRLILCDVPYFDAETQASLRAKMAVPMGISSELESLNKAWQFDIASRVPAVSVERAFELFVEHLRAGNDDYRAFAAAFSYDCEERFAAVKSAITVIATKSGLRDATLQAATSINNASLIDAEEITTAVFETHAEDIAGHVLRALNAS